MNLLEPQKVFLKYLKAIPFTGNHQKEEGLFLPLSMGCKSLTSITASYRHTHTHTQPNRIPVDQAL